MNLLQALLIEEAERITGPRVVDASTLYNKYVSQPPNEDLEDRIKYLHHSLALPSWTGNKKGQSFVCFFSDKKIVGMSALEESPHEQDVLWITFITVDPEFRQQGIGKRLIEETFKYAKIHKKKLRGSTYTDDGRAHLKRQFDELAKKYPDVPFKDGDDHRKF